MEYFQQLKQNTTFDINQLKQLLYIDQEDGQDKQNAVNQMQVKIINDELLRYNPANLQQSRSESYAHFLKIAKRYYEMFSIEDIANLQQFIHIEFQDAMHLSMHHSVFTWTLELLANKSQLQKWISQVKTNEIIGCYAQSELAHGSDVQNLETEAIFDKNNDEFIINTPKIQSTKFWIGEGGLLANHAIVFAQLIIDDLKVGIQPFIVPLRDINSHKPLKGIEIGDIGPKYGFNIKDNGYIKFNNIRIPRTNMLMKYINLNEHGELQVQGNPKMIYANMVKTRINFSWACFMALAHGASNAVRYSTQRHISIPKKLQENKLNQHTTIPLPRIIDQLYQQEIILNSLAQCYAYFFISKKIRDQYKQIMQNIEKNNDFSGLNSLHSLLAGIKAECTDQTAITIEQLRLSCKEMSVTSYNGFSELYRNFLPFQTAEGNNTVLNLQFGRFLIKNLQKFQENKKYDDSLNYLHTYGPQKDNQKFKNNSEDNLQNFLDLNYLQSILGYTAVYKINDALSHYEKGVKILKNQEESWNTFAQIRIVESSIANTQYQIYSVFKEQLESYIGDKGVKKVLENLCILYGLYCIQQNLSWHFLSGKLKKQQFGHIKQAKQKIIKELGQNIVGLVLAFQFSDNTLRSIFQDNGKNMYENFYDWISQYNLLNSDQQFQNGYYKLFRRIRKSNPKL